jgi:hypothetical protein
VQLCCRAATSIAYFDKLKIIKYIILPSCIMLANCQRESGYVELKLEDSTFTILARINPSPMPLTNSKAKVRAHLTILNRTPFPQEYGDRFLFLQTADGKARRTYLDALESYDMDFSTVKIKGADSLVIDVYWVFKRADKLAYQSLSFDRLALEQYLHNKRP